jgi:hypothetical protein
MRTLRRGGTTSTRIGRYRYGVLDDFGDILRWQDFPPLNHKFVKERVPVQSLKDILKKFTEQHGEALI